MTGQGVGHASLPIVVVPHPVGDRDDAVVKRRGEDIAAECVRLLTTPTAALADEFAEKHYPLTPSLMPR